MESADMEATGRRDRVTRCLAVAAVNRVSSVVPIFFGRLAGLSNTDRADGTQGVHLVWRELGGQPRADALRRQVRSTLPQLRGVAARSGMRGAAAVVSALDAISVLIEEPVDAPDHLRRSLAASLGVALDFDLLAVPAPAGRSSWLAHELHGQAELCELLPPSARDVPSALVSELRMRSGEEAMNYRNAMKSVLAAGR
ncbi:hypothetical protein [Micromonospora psammae]|uniref:hypothetical protein n=1 Tax=Micromonospora sp. CPCC 205556 TaxID=3122398 RepID=UPI002FF4347D